MKALILITITTVLVPLLSLRAELRTFKNTKGEEIKAELINATDSRAELKREDGKRFSVLLTSLSDADRAWITEWRKTHRNFKVEVTAAVRSANTRTEKGGAFGGKDLKGNDCWYVLNFSNKATEALSGLRVEYIIFAPPGAAVPHFCGTTDVAAIPPGKAGQAVTGKLFAPQTETVFRNGNFNTVQYSEATLAGIHAELIVAGKPAGTFLSGKVPEDAAAKLKEWREKQQPGKSE